MPLDPEQWPVFLKFVSTKKKKPRDIVFQWRLSTERLALQQDELQEEETKLLIVVIRHELQLVEIRLNLHGSQVVCGDQRLFRETLGVPFLRPQHVNQTPTFEVKKEQLRWTTKGGELSDLLECCLAVVPKQALSGGLELWRTRLDSWKALSRVSSSSFEPIFFLSKPTSTGLDELWEGLEKVQQEFIDLSIEIDLKKDEIFRLQQDHVLEVLVGPIRNYKQRYEAALQEARWLFQKFEEPLRAFIQGALAAWLHQELEKDKVFRQGKLEKEKDTYRQQTVVSEISRVTKTLEALGTATPQDEKGLGLGLAVLSQFILNYVSTLPIQRFKFRGFNDVSLDVLDFSKSLQENMRDYLARNKLQHLVEQKEKPVNPLSVQYIVSAGRLSRKQKLDSEDGELFDVTYDTDTRPLRTLAEQFVKAALEAAVGGFEPAMRDQLRIALENLCESAIEYLSATFHCAAEVIPRFNKLRVRALSGSGRRYYFVQRTTQSGDSNGMAVALMLFPEHHLHFMVGAKDVEKAKSFIDFYMRFGLTKERVIVSVVYSDKSPFAEEEIRSALSAHCRGVKLVRYLGDKEANKEDQLYQLVANTNYANDLELLYMNILYDFDNNVYQEVGASTGSIKRLIAKEGGNHIKVCRSVHWAMNQAIGYEERSAIGSFVETFLQNLTQHYDQKAERIGEKAKPWHPKEYISPSKARSLEKDVYVILVWIRGAQGDEGKKENLEPGNGTLVPKIGKPWHHATYALWATLRQISYQLMDMLGTTVCLVPVGDVLSSDNFHQMKQQTEEWNKLLFKEHKVKEDKAYYLTKFFEKLEVFKNRNRFTQMYLFYELFKQKGFRFAQVGLRSGAIEQGMYLGIPTVYIDIAQKTVVKARPGEQDTTKRMLEMTADRGGFPMFHCQFSINAIGVNPGYVGLSEKEILYKISMFGEEIPEIQGTLTGVEAQQMRVKLATLYQGYPTHYEQIRPYAPPNTRPQ